MVVIILASLKSMGKKIAFELSINSSDLGQYDLKSCVGPLHPSSTGRIHLFSKRTIYLAPQIYSMWSEQHRQNHFTKF